MGLTALGFGIAFWVSDKKTYIWHPDYDMLPTEDLKAIYDKSELDENDYKVLFEQTGLTKVGIDRARAQSGGWTRVVKVQQSYFKERNVLSEHYYPYICTDYIDGYEDGDTAVMGYLERGDILITSSTHFSGFRIGHSAIVTDGMYGVVYQSNQVGAANDYAGASDMFAVRINFMVLRIKPEYFSDSGKDDETYRQNLDRATTYIETKFTDVPYSFATGVFTKKDSMKATSCAHMLWYGFKHFDDEDGGRYNLDLDSNGKLLVVPKNISESPYVELVQTFGFNPDKMYE